MKRIVFLTCIGSLALTLTAWGADKQETLLDRCERSLNKSLGLKSNIPNGENL